MLETHEAAEEVHRIADNDVVIVFGSSIREDMKDEIKITVVATGFV